LGKCGEGHGWWKAEKKEKNQGGDGISEHRFGGVAVILIYCEGRAKSYEEGAAKKGGRVIGWGG